MLPNLMKAIAEKTGDRLASKAELETLRQLQADWLRARDTMHHHTDAAAKTEWLNQRAELAAAIRRGEAADLDAFSLAGFAEDYAEKMAAAKEAQRTICREALPLAQSISERFVESATNLAREIEAAEGELQNLRRGLYAFSAGEGHSGRGDPSPALGFKFGGQPIRQFRPGANTPLPHPVKFYGQHPQRNLGYIVP